MWFKTEERKGIILFAADLISILCAVSRSPLSTYRFQRKNEASKLSSTASKQKLYNQSNFTVVEETWSKFRVDIFVIVLLKIEEPICIIATY